MRQPAPSRLAGRLQFRPTVRGALMVLTTGDDAFERRRIGLRIEPVELGRVEHRSQNRPAFGPTLAAREQRVFLPSPIGRIERSTVLVSTSTRPSLRNIVRPSQWPSVYLIAIRKRGFGRDVLEHLGQPRLSSSMSGLLSLPCGLQAGCWRSFPGPCPRWRRSPRCVRSPWAEWRLRRLVDLHEPAPCMGKTEGEPDCSSLRRALGPATYEDA